MFVFESTYFITPYNPLCYSTQLSVFFLLFWQSSDSLISSPPKLVDGRLIYYHIMDEFGEVDEGTEGLCITFKGNSVDDLKKRLEDETGLEDITVCTRSSLNGKLYPLRLQLPPNNANMNVIILPSSSQEARDIAKPRMSL